MAVDTLHNIKAVGRGAGTAKPIVFSVEENLFLRELSNDAPLDLFDGKSGFVFNINGGGENVSGYIKVCEYDKISKKTDAVLPMVMTYKKDKTIPIAHTYRFRLGKFKGKSPAELLLKKEASVDDLKSQKNFLLQQLSKYPNNQEGINAIQNALELFEAGELKECSAVDSCIISIHDSETRYFAKADENGYHKGWKLEITCNLDNPKSPYNIKITNSKVKVANNLISEIADSKSAEISLTDTEWFSFLGEMDRLIKDVRMLNIKKRWEKINSST